MLLLVRPRGRVGRVAPDRVRGQGAAVGRARAACDLGKLEDEEEKKEQEKEAGELKDLVERTKKALGERVKEVRVTLRLTESPACLVADEHDLSANLQRMLKAAGQKAPAAKPILEVNPASPARRSG